MIKSLFFFFKDFILWSSAKLSLEWRTSTIFKMDAMCKDTNICSLCKSDSWNLHCCQIQQLELFYLPNSYSGHPLTRVFDKHWYSISQQWHCGYPQEALISARLGIESLKKNPELPKMLTCYIAGLLETNKQVRAPESTFKTLWNPFLRLVRAIPEPIRTWLHTKASQRNPR